MVLDYIIRVSIYKFPVFESSNLGQRSRPKESSTKADEYGEDASQCAVWRVI